jgi:vacuolar iron transporter family protein
LFFSGRLKNNGFASDLYKLHLHITFTHYINRYFMARIHLENHQTDRIGWLRAAVLGANDGIISTSSLMLGLIASGANTHTTLLTGLAGLVAGAMSMAAGEYVSVQSQADTEAADLAKERAELQSDPEHELDELTAIYRGRGLDMATAKQVAIQLTTHDALAAHARDELGITDTLRAKPAQAALSSAIAFTSGAALPILTALALPLLGLLGYESALLMLSTVFFLACLGIIAAKAGGTNHKKPLLLAAVRVVVWGAMAMLISAGAGRLLGTMIIG